MYYGYGNKIALFFIFMTFFGFMGLFFPYTGEYGFWFFETMGLTGFACFTPALVFFGTHIPSEVMKKPTKGTKSKGFYLYLTLGSLAPVIYIFSLPYLCEPSIFNEDQGFTVDLSNSTNSDKLQSISNYINTAQGTGGMASAMYFAFLFMYQAPTKIKDKNEWLVSKGGISLLVLTFGFMLCLAFPLSFNTPLHFVGVLIFAFGTVVH